MKIKNDMYKARSSYVLYTTSSGGYHIRGLTPLSTVSWAYVFKDLDMDLCANHSGHILRCNKKPNERQLLIDFDLEFVCADQITLMTVRQFPILRTLHSANVIRFEKWKSLYQIYSDLPIPYRLPAFKRMKRKDGKQTILGVDL